MIKLLSLLVAVALLVTAFGAYAVVSADTAGGNGFHYNDAGEPVMDFMDDADGAQIGTWWWKTNDAFNVDTRDKYLNFLEENGVNEIYYYGFYLLQSKSDRARLHEFVKEANDHGIVISFIYDDPEIATVNGNNYLKSAADDYLGYVAEYPQDKVNGLHFDVEGKSTRQFVNNMVAQFAAARERGVPLAMDVNCAMDATAGELNGVTGIYNIIAANVDTLSLMSYKDSYARMWSLGKNALAAAKAQGCRVVFGAETGDYSSGADPHNATFNDPSDEYAQEDKEYMYAQLAQVYAELKKDPPAGGFGIAVHQHEDWFNLRKSAEPVTTKKTEPTAPQGELKGKTLWAGDVGQNVYIGQPKPYQGSLEGDVAAAINAAIQADIRENGHIVGDEYYEITTKGKARGESGYATTGFVVGDSQIWSQDHFDGCGVIKKSGGTFTQRLMGDATDKMGRIVLPELMDETTEFVFFSDSDGRWTDVCTVDSLSISVYRHEKPSEPTGVSLLGDANDDGAVNMKDVLVMRKKLAGMDVSMNAQNADVNGDGDVNMKDVLMLRKYLAGLIKEFAE